MARRSRWSPNRRGTATSKQIGYLHILLNEAFSNLYEHRTGLDPRHLDDVSMTEASAAIDKLLAAKSRGWDRSSGGTVVSAPVTAETITDEQILALRAMADAQIALTEMRVLRDACILAFGRFSTTSRMDARARCAAAWNARLASQRQP